MCTLPLEYFLKVNPRLWEGVARDIDRSILGERKRKNCHPKNAHLAKDTIFDSKPPILVLLNKVGKYYKADEDNNTLLIEILIEIEKVIPSYSR